jgi:hypothetical protein
MSDNPYVVLAVSFHTISNGGQEMLDDLKDQFDEGWITNLVILCSRGNNSVKNITSYLNKRGHSWAANKIVSRLKDEGLNDYIVRVCIDYDVTHFTEPTRRILAVIARENYLSEIKLFQIKKGRWSDVRKWMFKTSPQCWRLIDKASDSFDIINTGFTLKVAKETEVRA